MIITELGLSQRAEHTLRRNGIHSTEQLTQMGDESILRLHGMGPTMLREIREKMARPERRDAEELAAYRATGLTPEEVAGMLNEKVILRLTAQADGITEDRLRELIQAEKDGRLVVLPFQQGKTLVARDFPERMQLMKNVRLAVAYDSCGIIFHYPFNTFVQNVESGCIFQVSEEAENMLAGKGGDGK